MSYGQPQQQPAWGPPAPPPRSRARAYWEGLSRRRRAALVGAGVVVLVAVSVAVSHAAAAGDTAPRRAAVASTAPSHAYGEAWATEQYTILREDDEGPVGSADLWVPGATRATAEAAIRDYAKGIDGPLSYSVQVVRNDGDATYVCDGEWRKDKRAAGIYGGSAGLTITCP